MMQLTIKPSPNSGRVNNFKSSPDHGKTQYEMVDLCGEDGTLWASAHIDMFHLSNQEDPAQDFCRAYDRLRNGQGDVTVELRIR